jgi:hypothetical protein
MLALVATGQWACIVPHTWLWTSLTARDIRVFELVDPVLTAQIAVATNSAGPGSPVARAFSASAQKLSLNQLFDAWILGRQRRTSPSIFDPALFLSSRPKGDWPPDAQGEQR